ncbi:enoyl-CoA hydratase-related protein [Pseudonocardia ailaonensis]|uniref:Enoyl-CoA hydratase-related protein n=1 Tax=Pseudonocardia ailaonensis TaxID=367279 RepID=A0ABN2N1W7_9PSEU
MSLNIETATSGDAQYVALERVPLDENGQFAAVVRLNRPEQLNAISWTVQRVLIRAIEEAATDDDVRIIFVTGTGRGFSAGGDIKAYAELQADAEAFTEFLDEYCGLLELIGKLDKPVIALVNGLCAAGGTELLLACDFAWAAESARIGDMHINFAQIGGAGALARLPRLIGSSRALELMLSGRMLDAREALDWGLVNRVLPDEDLLPAALDFARQFAGKSRKAAEYMKKTVWNGLATDTPSALRLERDSALEYLMSNPDSMEGIRAFIEKRKPDYRRLR